MICQIFQHLDIPSALSFSLISIRFAPLAEARLWRNLNLDLPLVDSEITHSHTTEYHSLDEDSAIAAEADKRLRLEDKMRTILCEGDQRRFAMVDQVICRPRPLATNAMMQILDLVSPNLKDLEILGLASIPPRLFNAYDARPSSAHSTI